MITDRLASQGGFSYAFSMIVPRTWKWVVVAFSYYVIIHLGTYLLAPVVRMTGPHIWTFVALELLVSAYLGWKTSDHILSDMLIAGTLYAAMIDMTYPVAPEVHTTLMALVRILSYLVIGSLGIIGAILGRLLRLRFTPTETQKTPA